MVLVDEINRAGPKTQSALLEAMEERQVSVEREVFALPADFLVLATQNPQEFGRDSVLHFPSRNSTGSCCVSMWTTLSGPLKQRSSRAMVEC